MRYPCKSEIDIGRMLVSLDETFDIASYSPTSYRYLVAYFEPELCAKATRIQVSGQAESQRVVQSRKCRVSTLRSRPHPHALQPRDFSAATTSLVYPG
jgi:hypothetical protein